MLEIAIKLCSICVMGNEKNAQPAQLTKIEKYSDSEVFLSWNTGPSYAVPYRELRFLCPCAVCVDERTGERVIKKEHVAESVRPTGVQPVGRYAVQINWSDGHSTGIYHFEKLLEICERQGKAL